MNNVDLKSRYQRHVLRPFGVKIRRDRYSARGKMGT